MSEQPGSPYTRTELVWAGKRTQVERVALPFQRVERVNTPRGATLFSGLADAEQARDGWRNKLIWGDNKLIMASLLQGDPSAGIESLAGKVDLIYIDPPFDTGADFSYRTHLGAEEIMKEPGILEQLAYRDTWGSGTDSYLQMMHDRLALMHDLLSERGSVYIHIGPQIHPYVHLILNELFRGNVAGDIVWKRVSAHSDSKWWGVANDIICYSTKSEQYTFNKSNADYSEEYVKSHYSSVDSDSGRPFTTSDLTAAGLRSGTSGAAWRGFDPRVKGRHWAIPSISRPYLTGDASNDTMVALDQLDAAGRISWPSKADGWPRFKRYLEEMSGVSVGNVWTDIHPVNSQAKEDTRYDTQKPDALLERIIKASSNEGDLVADFFCGSGTTAAVAQKLGRRWVACDLGRFAVHTTRKRLLDLGATFDVYNLGKYERSHWQGATLGEELRAYVDFVLGLYRAEPIDGFRTLHGKKAGRAVHVGAVDAPVTFDEIADVLRECQASGTAAVDLLGWEWEMGVNQRAPEEARQAGVDLKLYQIPNDVMDKRAKAADVTFYSLAYLEAAVERFDERTVQVKLTDFIIADMDLIPAAVREKVTRWSDFIDYWAVDFAHQPGEAFRNDWQAFRTRARRTLETTSVPHTYPAPGTYTVLVKVVDVFGIDSTKQLEVTV